MIHEYRAIESILVLDCGSTRTRAIWIDQVDGQYRLIARTEAPATIESPWNDMMVSVRRALNHLSEVTNWRFMDERGQIISPGHREGGVDAVVAVTSASRLLRLIVSGIVADMSFASARRALSASPVAIEGVISVDRRESGRFKTCDDVEGQIRLIHELAPDAVILVGGVDGGASSPVLQSAEAVALACLAMTEEVRPLVIYAGNADLRLQVAERIGSITELRAVDNVLPSLGVENPGPLQAEVEELYRQTKMERVPGFATLASWSSVQVLPTAKGWMRSIQYLARLSGINVLGVDVGGATVTLASVVDEQPKLLIRSDLGLTYNITRILDLKPMESILRWLPFEIDPTTLRNQLHEKAICVQTLPQTREDLLLEQAVAREMVQVILADMEIQWPKGPSLLYPELLPKFHLIIGGGGVLANAPSYGQAALVLLDALQPIGISGLALDHAGLLGPLGAVAMIHPVAAAQVMEKDALLSLGTVVAPVGTGHEGEIALKIKVTYEDGRSLEVEVPYGSLEIISLPTGHAADLELRPTRRFDVGLGVRGQAGKTRVEGGLLGIIVDARGRPLPVASAPKVQREKIQHWLWDVGS